MPKSVIYDNIYSIRESYYRIQKAIEGYSLPPTWPESPTPNISGDVKCAIQYIDLSGSTILSLKNTPIQYARYVMSFNNEVARIVYMYGGYPLKFVGDAVISVFLNDDIDIIMRSTLATMNMIHHAYIPATGIEASIHVGLDYGDVYIIKQNNGVDVLGKPMNFAAKLLALRRQVMMTGNIKNKLSKNMSSDIKQVYDESWIYDDEIYEYTGGFHV